jgi:SAM-dependent methyltransferase
VTAGGDYGHRYAEGYRRGRTLPDEAMADWGAVIARWSPAGTRLVMDLGAGTGRFSGCLAARLTGAVVAVEPSATMTKEAVPVAGVHWVRARSERIPLAGDSCDVVWASQVLHLVHDLAAVAGEVARVLRVGGRLLVRGVFGESFETVSWLPWFPEARAIGRDYFDLGALTARLAANGLSRVAHDQVNQVVAPDLAGLYERTSARADSILGRLSDDEFGRGLARLRADALDRPEPHPVAERIDLVVYELG